MEIAAKVLIVGGVLNLAYRFVTGLFVYQERQQGPTASKYLMLAHVGPLMQGAMLLGLALAAILSDLPGGVETFAASLLVAAADTLNWRQGVQDMFAERPPLPYALSFAQGPLAFVGLAIIIVGVFK